MTLLSTQQLAAIDAELISGNLIAAIREHRAITGSDLVTAKQFIDARHAILCATAPAAFPQPIITLHPDPAIMATITPVADHELRSLQYVLKQIEKLLYGVNYEVTLSASAAALSHDALPVIETMATLYPDSEPGKTEITAVSITDFKAGITGCLTYDGDSSSGPQFSYQNRSRLDNQLIPDLWREIVTITSFDESSILSYNDDTGLPGYYVFWFFAYLIHNPANGRCLVLTGMSSD